ncbi:MAG: hypothetical protein KC417_12700, partial [Myxococcales bacterium]|nr:hypothetical protein [Myxococcales bacterium]
RGIRELGFPVDPDRFDYDEFVTKFGPDFYRPTKDEGGVPLHTAGVVTAQLVEFFSRKSANFHNIQVPPELLLGLRAYYGTLYVLAELGTGVDRSSVEFHAAVDTAVRSAELALAPS